MNPDVAAVLGANLNAVQHFLQYGSNETRAISPFIDLAAYLAANPDVAGAVAAGQLTALQHLMNYGVLEGRDLGNGIDLAIFQHDPAFTDALGVGNHDLALARMAAVAPFLPGFQPPDGWTPAPDTPIPVDFVPPAGVKLVVLPGVVVPDALLPLPDTFESDHSGGGGGGGGAAFTVTDDGSGHFTVGSLNGDVVITVDGDDYVFTPAMGTAVRVPVTDVAGLVVNDISLSGTAVVLSGMSATGTGGVVVRDLHEKKAADNGFMDADLSGLDTAQVSAYYDAAQNGNISNGALLGSASVFFYNSDSGVQTVTVRSTGTAPVHLGSATIDVPDNVAVVFKAAAALKGGVQVVGTGHVTVQALTSDADLSGLADSLTVKVNGGSDLDISANTTLGAVDAYSWSSNQLTLTAAQADGRPIDGKGVVAILGADGNQTLDVSTSGVTGGDHDANFIAGGLGADQITLSGGEDIVVVGGARPATAQETTLSFSTDNADYVAGAQLRVTIQGQTIQAGAVAGDAAGSLQALADAINLAIVDPGGLNGVLVPLGIDHINTGSGEISLVAATAGLAGEFTVADAVIDSPDTAQQSTLTFSTTDGDYREGGILRVTIDGFQIEANAVAGSVADSLQALVSAINAAIADTDQLDGALNPLTAGDVAGGVITLTASAAGAAGAFVIADPVLHMPASLQTSTITFNKEDLIGNGAPTPGSSLEIMISWGDDVKKFAAPSVVMGSDPFYNLSQLVDQINIRNTADLDSVLKPLAVGTDVVEIGDTYVLTLTAAQEGFGYKIWSLHAGENDLLDSAIVNHPDTPASDSPQSSMDTVPAMDAANAPQLFDGTVCPEDARDVSESPAIDNGWDVITGFTVNQDHLLLEDGHTVVTAGSITVDSDIYAINDKGIVVGTNDIGELDTILQALADELTTSQAAVAFEHDGHTYVFQSDGTSGLTAADTLIQLAGLTGLDDLNDILVPFAT